MSISMSKREIATKTATINAADSDQTYLVIKNAARTMSDENSETTAAWAIYSGNPVIKMMLEVKMWYPGNVSDIPLPIWKKL